jgi:RimJ/RimL family protein N-acetyltransferase
MLSPAFPLRTERLLLRPFTDDDADAMFAIYRREDVTRYLYLEPRTRDDVRETVGRRKLEKAIESEGDGLNLAAQLHGSPTMIGHVSLQFASEVHRQGEIGFIITESSGTAGVAE